MSVVKAAVRRVLRALSRAYARPLNGATVGNAVAALMVGPLALAAQGRMRPADVDRIPAGPATARISYGQDSLNFGDLRVPAGATNVPVVVIIHGGCWVHRLATLQNTNALADALSKEGVATWNVEYRRYDNPGGGWPGTMRDIADAVDALRTIARTYPIDTANVVLTGHSAGGHLALWAAARHRLPAKTPLTAPAPLAVRAAVALGGPGDLQDFMTYGQRSCGTGVIDKLLGGTYDQVPERWTQVSPVHLLPHGVPQRLIAGDADFIMPRNAIDAYERKARDAGDTIDHRIVEDAGHFEVIAPTSTAWPVVRDGILELLRQRTVKR